MTLILNAVVGDYIVQVSDRRLTKNGKLEDDETNKAVLFCNRFCFSYTGLAHIGMVPTDRWLTQALVNSKTGSISTAINSLAVQATQAFSQMVQSRALKRQAFVGAGWALLPNERFLSPIFCSVSNAHTSSNIWLDKAEDKFTAFHRLGADKPVFDVFATGQPLTSREMNQLRRCLRRCFERKTGPEPIAKCLVNSIYTVADRNPLVGKSLMVVCLPKQSVLSNSEMFLTNLSPSATMTMRDMQSFYYVSKSGRSAVQFAPNTVCMGQGLRDFKAERMNESGTDATTQVTIVLPES